ncbi:asparagine synthase-related protein [Azospirillum sp. sgz301742]
MRLICGLVCLDGAPADAATLDAMVAALTAPGLAPRVTRRVDGPAALAVLDFPGVSADGPAALPQGADGTWLAADVRLDRPGALAAALGLQTDMGPADEGAEALTLAALARWGEDLPDRLDGDFAVAAWDPRQRRLLCARDIMGTRPLCYTHRPGRLFAFASLPRGLHASGVVPPRPDRVALGRLLIEVTARGAATGFQDIAWLRAGHSLTVTPDGVRLHRAWRPDAAQVGRWRGSAAEAAATLRTLIEEAVTGRLPPSGPVAVHLSGGLDSSTITVIAARRLRAEGRRLHAFSQLADPSHGLTLRDEREFVEAVLAQEPDIAWSPAYLSPLDGDGANDRDLPLSGPLVASDERICAAAAAAGAGLLLSGAGGDEGATYNGANLYAALLRQGRWRGLAVELPARARRDGQPLRRVVTHRLILPFVPDWLVALRRRLLGRPARHERRDALAFLVPSFAAEVAAALPPAADWRNRPQDRVEMLTEGYLVGRGDRWSILGARHGVAFSSPLLDRRIIDFILSLPLERFLDGGFSRQPFRNAMAGILPEAIRWRDSKFVPFPDLPLNLAASKAGLLARLDRLRGCPAVTALFDLDAIAAVLGAMAEGAEAEGLVTVAQGHGAVPPALPRAMSALRALTLAGHVARLG